MTTLKHPYVPTGISPHYAGSDRICMNCGSPHPESATTKVHPVPGLTLYVCQTCKPNEPLALPARAKRVLIDTLLKGVGTRLAIDWYDYQRASNFDKSTRAPIKQAAEAAGFIEYRGGHPWVTDAGYQWALSQ